MPVVNVVILYQNRTYYIEKTGYRLSYVKFLTESS